MMNKKVVGDNKLYVVTSLFESEDEGAEVNVIGIVKTIEEARNLMAEVLEEAKEMYSENDIDYKVTKINDNTIEIITIFDEYDEDEDDYDEYDRGETITYNIFEREVEE